mmetsp:Transcript_22253/g.30351  ORF Transcript_22253/g.30351 Transcript_22253/m.30351 type:complete len:240 (+) Transcript_22253:58-777(+)
MRCVRNLRRGGSLSPFPEGGRAVAPTVGSKAIMESRRSLNDNTSILEAFRKRRPWMVAWSSPRTAEGFAETSSAARKALGPWRLTSPSCRRYLSRGNFSRRTTASFPACTFDVIMTALSVEIVSSLSRWRSEGLVPSPTIRFFIAVINFGFRKFLSTRMMRRIPRHQACIFSTALSSVNWSCPAQLSKKARTGDVARSISCETSKPAISSSIESERKFSISCPSPKPAVFSAVESDSES